MWRNSKDHSGAGIRDFELWECSYFLKLKCLYWTFSLLLCRGLILKGVTANFSSCVLDVTQYLSLKTNQYFIIIISISCQYMSVHPLIWIILKILCLPTAYFNFNSPKKNKMVAATIECKFLDRDCKSGVLEVFWSL